MKKFSRRYINGDSCFMPTMHARRLPGREGEGDGTVIIMRIKEVEESESENCVSCFRRGAVATEGEGHQKQEAQSVNPLIESSETNYFGEEGHQKHKAQSVNSLVRYNKVCYSPYLHLDTRRDPRSSVAETEYSEEDEIGKSAKVDAIQHSYLGPEIADALGTQYQVIRFDTKHLLHHADAQCCVVGSQHVHSGRNKTGILFRRTTVTLQSDEDIENHQPPIRMSATLISAEVRVMKSLRKCVGIEDVCNCVSYAFLSRSTSILSTILQQSVPGVIWKR